MNKRTKLNSSNREILPAAARTALCLKKEKEKAEKLECQQMENSIKQQIFHKTSQICNLSGGDQLSWCTNCGEKFHIKSCYDFHVERKTVKIYFFCRVCNKSLTFYNRCKLLAHMLSHASAKLSFRLADMKIYPLLLNDEANISVPDTVLSDQINLTSDKSASANSNSSDLHLLNDQSADNVSLNTHTAAVNDNLSRIDNIPIEISENPNNIVGLPEKTTTTTEINVAIHTKAAENQMNKCPECAIVFVSDETKAERFLHFNKVTKSYSCKDCTLNMPNLCALKAHIRMHYNISPYVCPDCGVEFSHLPVLVFHATFICLHLTHKLYTNCIFPACTFVSDVTEIPQHIKSNHVNHVFKCKLCVFASYAVSGLKTHHDSSHAEIPYSGADIYQHCSMCPSLLVTPSRLEHHLQQHLPKKGFRVFVCPGCNTPSKRRTNYQSHRNNCTEYMLFLSKSKKALNDINVKLLYPHTGNASNAVLQTLNESLLSNTCEILKRCDFCNKSFYFKSFQNTLNSSMSCPTCNKPTVDVLEESDNVISESDITENIQIDEDSVDIPMFHEDKLLESSEIDHIRDPKTYQCHICKLIVGIDPLSINSHFSTHHTEIKILDIKVVLNRLENECNFLNSNIHFGQVEEDSLSIDSDSNDITSDKTERTELFDNFDNQIFKSKKRRKLKNKKPKNDESITPFTTGILISQNDQSSNGLFSCIKCDFRTSEKHMFQDHIVAHRDVSTAYQCMECGSSFTVKPSFATHLFISHQINNVEEYIVQNNCFDEKAVKQFKEDFTFPLHDKNDWPVEELQCRICRDKFDNQYDYDKHFRVHGLAFLLNKQKEKNSP